MTIERGPDPLDKALGAVVRVRRKRLSMSQGAMAEEIGVTFQQVQKYEKGANRISFSMLTRIAQALGCRASELIAELDTGNMQDGVKSAGDLLIERGAVELLESYQQIRSKEVRVAVLDLCRKLAKPE